MMKLLVYVVAIKLVAAGYLPPPDGYYDNRTPMCACDEVQISSLTEKVSDLELNLEHHKARSDALEKRVDRSERSKRHVVDGQVAFTAYLSQSRSGLGIGQAIIFDRTLTNEGGQYSTSTGKFTAPLDGLYLFSFIIETKHVVDTAARLVVDGLNMLDAVAEPRQHEQNIQGGNVGIIKLTKGQEVWVQIYNSVHQTLEGGDTYRFTTFSGVLLNEMDIAQPSVTG